METSGIFKTQKLMGRNFQYGGNIEQRVQRQCFGDVWRLQVANESGRHPDLLRQFLLSQAPELPVVGDFQPDLTVLFLVNRFHAQFLQRPFYGSGL